MRIAWRISQVPPGGAAYICGNLYERCYPHRYRTTRVQVEHISGFYLDAQAWGSEESIQRLPLQQQAYMTAALVQGLQLLGRKQLESTTGLFPALLTGVSARLDSPEGPLRHVYTNTFAL